MSGPMILIDDIAGGADSRLTAGGQPGGARLPRRNEFQIAGGASSSRLAGDDCRGATGNPGAVQPPPAPRPEDFGTPDEVRKGKRPSRTVSRPAGAPAGATGDAAREARPKDPVSVYVTADTAALLALLAAERGETLADAVARLAVDAIERKGGIAHV